MGDFVGGLWLGGGALGQNRGHSVTIFGHGGGERPYRFLGVALIGVVFLAAGFRFLSNHHSEGFRDSLIRVVVPPAIRGAKSSNAHEGILKTAC